MRCYAPIRGILLDLIRQNSERQVHFYWGPGSLFTSILPNIVIEEIGQALLETKAEIAYVCNIMTQRGETEHFTDSDHVEVLHRHLGRPFIDTVLVNIDNNDLERERGITILSKNVSIRYKDVKINNVV